MSAGRHRKWDTSRCCRRGRAAFRRTWRTRPIITGPRKEGGNACRFLLIAHAGDGAAMIPTRLLLVESGGCSSTAGLFRAQKQGQPRRGLQFDAAGGTLLGEGAIAAIREAGAVSAGEDPVLGGWYRDIDLDRIFQVVAFDDTDGVVEVQFSDGDVQALELDEWQALTLEPATEPDEWYDADEYDDDEVWSKRRSREDDESADEY